MAGTRERRRAGPGRVSPPAIAGRWRAPGAKLGGEPRVTAHPPGHRRRPVRSSSAASGEEPGHERVHRVRCGEGHRGDRDLDRQLRRRHEGGGRQGGGEHQRDHRGRGDQDERQGRTTGSSPSTGSTARSPSPSAEHRQPSPCGPSRSSSGTAVAARPRKVQPLGVPGGPRCRQGDVEVVADAVGSVGVAGQRDADPGPMEGGEEVQARGRASAHAWRSPAVEISTAVPVEAAAPATASYQSSSRTVGPYPFRLTLSAWARTSTGAAGGELRLDGEVRLQHPVDTAPLELEVEPVVVDGEALTQCTAPTRRSHGYGAIRSRTASIESGK